MRGCARAWGGGGVFSPPCIHQQFVVFRGEVRKLRIWKALTV